ncbi:MAG: Uma2 family endonuclease [Candidatus Parabeggiatoa sp. nov. 3]|nr:MAG: Uma2 family endonuclease [Gammaproteobacteria bacterium]
MTSLGVALFFLMGGTIFNTEGTEEHRVSQRNQIRCTRSRYKKNTMPIAARQSETSQTSHFQEETNLIYPETDGQPIADSDAQRKPLIYLINALDSYFSEQRQVYVSGDLLIYYEKGNPKASVAPDVFVVFGVPKHPRKTYKTWIEGKAPNVVIEIASSSTFHKDEKVKPQLYQGLGVQEYFQFDPTGDLMWPVLRGHYLDQNGQYQQMIVEQLKEDTLMLSSRVLGLEFHVEKDELRVFDPKTKAYLFTYSEAVQAHQLAQKQATLERKRKEWALRDALLERERADNEQERADLEQERADNEQERADKEQERAEKKEEEVKKERERADKEQERAEKKDEELKKERERADKLAERLRALGISPNDI